MWSIPFGRRSGGFRHRSSSNKQHSSRRSARKSLTLEKLEDRYLLAGDVLYQINVGGESLLGNPAWEADTSSNPAIYSNAAASDSNAYSTGSNIDLSHASIPAGTPEAVFQSERWDPPSGQEMQWDFAVTPGKVEVRLFFAEIYSGAQSVGGRTFDVSIEGQQVLDNYDVFADVGADAGVVKSFIVTSDANLDIDFSHVQENPALKGIQILTAGSSPDQLGVSSSQVDFGGVVIDETSLLTIQLTNLGESGNPSITFDPGTASLSGTDNTSFGFSFVSGGPITLAPGESTDVTLTFNPTVEAPHSATLNIPHNGSNSPLQVDLSGQGEIFVNFDWTTAAPSPIPRMESGRVVVDGKIYLFGGLTDSSLNATTRVDVYDPASDSWTQLSDMPDEITHAIPVVDGNTVWIVGGFYGDHPGAAANDVWMYDIRSNTWSQGTDLPELRAGGGTAIIGRELHYFGGYASDRQTNEPDHWVLDLDNPVAWTTAADMPSPRGHLGVAVLDGKIYAIGGQVGHDGTNSQSELVHAYDPTTDTWTQVASLPFARSHHEGGTFVQDGHIIVAGGQTNTIGNTDDVSAYDPTTDTWKTLPTLPVGLNSVASAVINNQFYVLTGTINGNTSPTTTSYVSPWNNSVLNVADPPSSTAESFVEIDPGGSIDDASTFHSGSFRITNNSPDGQKIESVRFDLSSALFADLVFDPFGAAGDLVGKDVSIDSGASQTGYTGRTFSLARHGGYQGLELTFNDFDQNDQVTFSVDLDPSNILDAAQPGPEHSGSISGAEMTGAVVTITYDDGTVHTAQIYRSPNSDVAGQNIAADATPAAPAIEVIGIANTPATVAGASQVVRITGAAGATAQLLIVEAAQILDGVPNGGFDVDPYEANKAILFTEQSVTIGASGFVDVSITLTKTHNDGGYNHIVAVTKDANGRTSDVAKIILEYDPTVPGNQSPVLADLNNQAVLEGDTLVVPIAANDPNGDNVTLSHSGLPSFATFNDNGDGTGSITFNPQAADAGTHNITVTATDDGTPPLADNESFSLTVTAPAASGAVVYRVNAGGSEIAGDPTWEADTTGNPSGHSNSSSTNTFSQSLSIDTSHASIPVGTPEAVFQSERWDPSGGSEMQWDFAVDPGTYEVRLYFAEIYFDAQSVGARTFDVSIESQQVLDDYDIFADVGANAGVVKSFVVTSDANLDIDFGHVNENPAIKAIEIIDANGAANALGSSLTQINYGNVSPGDSASQVVLLTNQGGSGDPSITIDPSSANFTGSHQNQFSVTFASTNPIVLAPGESTNVTIEFNPNAEEAMAATLNIPHSGDNTPLSIAVGGVGEYPSIGFGKSTLAGASSSQPTSVQFGPDGRLYVAQQDGLIKIYTIERTDANVYQVLATETITSIQSITNHDDDGTVNPTINERLITGILVKGTANNPIIYVGSSDPRIGAGSSGEDLNLDTNSGIISRLTWNGSSWDKLDLVRGLPRSEENHATNGLQLDEATNTLYVAQGGHTNMGATSNNFAFQAEYALSAAILSIDLDAIGNTTYDLPTLDDEDRPGTNDGGNDPFGGNNGKNQAILVPGGPVQVYAPGFRNPYDIVFTELGRLYSIDNGPNAGWGDVPVGEGTANVSNARNEPGESYGDGLHFITGQGYYAGHPNPTRANLGNTFNTTNPQSPVSVANVVESDYLIPGVEDGALVVYGASTNGLTEYTASNFGGALKGDLLAASFDNSIKRVKLDAEGDDVVLNENLFNSVGIVPLDVTAVGDNGLFPGTIWAVDIATSAIIVFEPSDFDGSGGEPVDPNDLDGDGYTNADEEANGTNPNSAADIPADFDGDFISDLLDNDDDNDSLLDTVDPFAIDANNGNLTAVGLSYTWENDDPDAGGLLNLGFTGLMTNGTDNYADLYDPSGVTAGGAAGVFTIDNISEGDATGSLNTQEQAYQFGVDIASANTPVTAHTRILAPFAGETPQGNQSMGLFIGNGDQDNYVKIIVTANNGNPGITYVSEIGGVVTNGSFDALALPGAEAVDLYLTIDNSANTVQASYDVTTGGSTTQRVLLGSPIAIPQSWLTGETATAVGIISTSVGSAPPISVTWDLIEVLADGEANLAPTLAAIANQTIEEGSPLAVGLSATDPNGDNITLSHSGLPSFATLNDNGDGTGSISFAPQAGDEGIYNITVTAKDDGSPALSDNDSFTLTVTAPVVGGTIVHRVNAGGSSLAGDPSWEADSSGNPSDNSNAALTNAYTTGISIDLNDASIPDGTPEALFQSERWDPSGGDEMQWDFAVDPGEYEVRLYFAEIYSGAMSVGARTFDVSIEGQQVLDNYDIYADVGGNTGVVKSFIVTSDANLDIDFGHVNQNPAIKGIEIITVGDIGSQGTGPVLTPIADVVLAEDGTRQIAISSTGQSLSHNGLPSFATLNDNNDGTGTLNLAPADGDAGTYNVTIIASRQWQPGPNRRDVVHDHRYRNARRRHDRLSRERRRPESDRQPGLASRHRNDYRDNHEQRRSDLDRPAA